MAAKAQEKTLATTNVILLTVLISVVFVIGGVFIGKHLFAQLKLNQKVASKKSTAAHQLAANLQAAPSLVSDYKSQSAAVHQEISDALPATPDIPGLVAMMDHITGASGVQMQSLTPDTAPAASTTSTTTPTSTTSAGTHGSSPTPVSFGISTSSTYAALLTMLNNLQISARPLQLTSLSVQGTGSGITATLTLTTYYETAPSLALGTETVK